MNRYACIHGHFYQPPRENAWLEEIEVQDSAYPYHDWNARISAECYAPNAASRILDQEDRIIDIVNNYARTSFDMGPTLLRWMEANAPEVYQAVLQADAESRGRFHGHGGAMAQAYSHMIMPLASKRDKRTQVLWGIRDFEARFRRPPEGLWLPETAVDFETLDILAELGIKFTILSPYQASHVRKNGAAEWTEAAGGRIDPKMPYACRLPSGRTIALFFYDGPISHDIAFGDVLRNGEGFAERLASAFSAGSEAPELVHVATDGETYGHHHRFGDMALAYCLRHLETKGLAEITVYADYLERFPPSFEVKILENTAWSCGHGVERWRSDCGDSSGAHPRWNQKWRTPLREAMDWLRGKTEVVFERGMKPLVKDAWSARDDYVGVILDRSAENVEAFFARHAARRLSPDDKIRVLKLLEIERHAMLIYASDGWFFDDISGVETVQIIQYAARAMQLVRDVGGGDLESGFTAILEKAKSNVPEYGNGARVFEMFVKPAIVDFPRLGAHYAVSSLFEEYPQAIRIAHYEASSVTCERSAIGKRRLAAGRVKLKSEITWEERTMAYAVLHFGDQNLEAGVRDVDDDKAFAGVCRDVKDLFAKSDMTGVMRRIDRYFGSHHYSLWSLFTDERRKVVNVILQSNLRGLEAVFRQIFESNYALMQAMREMRVPLPEALSAPAEFVLDADLRAALENEPLDPGRLEALIQEFKTWDLAPDKAALGYLAGGRIAALMVRWAQSPGDAAPLRQADAVLKALKPLALEIDLWKSQNLFVSRGREIYAGTRDAAAKGDEAAKAMLAALDSVAQSLRISPEVFKTT